MKIRAFRVSLFAGLLMVWVGVSQADEPPSRAEFEALQKRLSALETLVRQQAVTIEQQAGVLAAREAAAEAFAHAVNTPEVPDRPSPGLPDWLELSGVLEMEAAWDETDEAASSDLVVATAALNLGITVNEWIHGDLGVLYEEDETSALDLDVATITLGDGEAFPLLLTVGKMYLPFGTFETNFVSDPLTLELGETRETAALVGGEFGPFGLQAAVFNGDAEDEDPDVRNHAEDYLLAASFVSELGSEAALGLQVAYLSNLADSDTLQDEVAGPLLDDKVAGWAASAHLQAGPVGLIGEYLAAVDKFAAGDLAFAPAAARPELESWYVEAYAELTERLVLAIRYEQSRDLEALLPAERYGVACSYNLYSGKAVAADLGLEYLHGRYDDAADTRQDTVTLQLAIGF